MDKSFVTHSDVVEPQAFRSIHSAVFIVAFSFAMWLNLTFFLSLDAGVMFPGRQVTCLRQS